SVMNPEERRNLGAHYTSEKNILKLIKPLFLDELRAEFEKVKSSKPKLKEFHKKLSTLKFLDPACGSGNFLIITYRELRLLEIDILRELYKKGEAVLDISHIIWLDVDQFYGIEYDEFASRIAEVAMWLIDHQMNMRISEEFGQYFVRLPLKKAAKIVNTNALRIDWQEVIPNTELSYILGNPPFVGERYQSKEQRDDLEYVFSEKIKLDYVAAWYYLASKYIENTKIKVAFVSTNSIVQGEQVHLLWEKLYQNKVKINFAHTTFKWNNEAKGKAAVFVVIIGFANFDINDKKIFEYEDITGEAYERRVKKINSYLVDANEIFIQKCSKPISNITKMQRGSDANDRGNLLFTENEKNEFIGKEPLSEKYFKQAIGAREFINNIPRFTLWLENVNPKELRRMKHVLKIIETIKLFRDKTPHLFGSIRKPKSKFLFVPQMSSSNRIYIPIGYLNKDVIPLGPHFFIDNAQLFDFGILTSAIHMTWVKYVCGRLKSDYRYSNSIVYNNYPWPKEPSSKNKTKVELKAQKVLDVREEFPDSSLADLYDPLTMPPKLVKAHQELDKAVDLCYRPQAFTSENARIEYLFDLYNEYTSPMFNEKKTRR
ncbi:MAG: class I SAM-dependent DNA methyltransferase, partial [Victivallaceae bacterium]|nr:class I SAM-dependent DNA methyltransferase [Victivallaceae bacterium]